MAAFAKKLSAFYLWCRALRIHQWVKNILIFVPFILGGGLSLGSHVEDVCVGFLILCFTASATYIFNDIVDLRADRAHVTKCHRPFASGQIPINQGIIASVFLIILALFLSYKMPEKFIDIIASYVALTVLYSLTLKRQPIIDVLSISVLFTLRIAAGMVLIVSPASYWLLLFSFFFFLSLALVKRYSELQSLADINETNAKGRAYVVTDRPFVMATGLASAFAGCLVFVIYIANENFPHNVYSTYQWLWAICGILVYWLVRTWFLAFRGVMNQDPIIFALRDKASIAMGFLTILCIALAW